jgi:selenocysteine lyase/cysteine desulfurase
MFDVDAIRRQFPILSTQINGCPLLYLDSAATAPSGLARPITSSRMTRAMAVGSFSLASTSQTQ